MAMVSFKKGTAAQLSSCAIKEGQILVVTDEGSIYVDIGESNRIRIGDFITVNTYEALPNPASEAKQNSLYYVSGEEKTGLYKSNGESWIALDTGATNLVFSGGGETNSGFSASYDESSRTLTITIAAELMTEEKVKALIHEDEESLKTLKETVDKLDGDISTNGSVKKQISDAKTELVGDTSEAGEEDTIKGAKKYAEKYAEEKIAAAISSTYKPGGSKTADELTGESATDLLTKTNEGKVFNASEEFTTTDKFVEGTGKKYPAGTNVVVIEKQPADGEYVFDVLAGITDLTGYAKLSDVENAKTTLIGSNEKIEDSTIKGAANEAITKANQYTDTKIAEVNAGLEWGNFEE